VCDGLKMTEKKLLEFIRRAVREEWTEMYLSNKRLTSIPPEIAQLTKVRSLYLGDNTLTSLPAEIGQLTNLESLNLGGNRITSLPSEIGQLINLTSLDLGSNALTSLPAELWELKNLTSLDLRSNRLSSLPPELWEFTNLTNLNVAGNRIASLPSEIGHLINLTSLDLGGNALKSLPAELWQLKNLTRVDLGGNGLRSLPPEIKQFSNLTSLNLQRNGLTSLPPELWEFTNLTNLNVAGNRIASLPSQMGQLINLTSLDLGSNALTSLPAELWQLKNLTRLDLRSNRLRSLPPELKQLTNLTSLNLESNELASLPGGLRQLTNLTTLNLQANGLTSLPAELWELKNLTSLDLRGNRLRSLPPELWEFTNLTNLNVAGNRITSLPSEIGQLINLTSLDLGGNALTSLPAELWELKNLTSLDLRSNGLRSLPPELWQFTNLTNLNVAGNRITSLPSEIGQLINLTSLDLGGNALTSVAAELWELRKLTTLNLASNPLTSLSAEIGQLTNIRRLSLEGNGLTSLPAELWELINLRSLDLRNNRLTSLPREISQLSNLTTLILEGNALKSVPPEVVQLKKLKTLALGGNPLESPPWLVANRGVEAIRDYFRQLETAGKDYLYEAKLLIVGEAGAGKTTLAKKLDDPNYELEDEDSTPGINVIEWHFTMEMGRDFRVNIWDFGGQEIYHATHQFFLTKRSLYCLLADTRKEDTDFYWWLNVVELLSDNSPVLIVKNEKQDRHREMNENALRGQFGSIKEILATNLASNRGLGELEKEIKHHMSKLPHVGDELPNTWVKVREALERDKRNYISLDEYLEVCERHGFRLEKDKLQLSSYLHDLGVCLHFQDDPVLRKTVILKPEWATAAVYKLLDDPDVIKNKGRFNEASLQTIWDEPYYANMQAELLKLMINFKLCYKIRDSEDYIAPELMRRNQPEYDWDGENNLVLRYTYEFMPKGIITQFIVAMQPWIVKQDWVWREGVILEKDETRAEVIENYGKREIKIRIVGKHRKELMTIVVYEFDRINTFYNRLNFSKLIPCNCQACSGNPQPHFYSFDTLREFVANQQYEIQCQRKPYEMVNVLRLIDDVIEMREVGVPSEHDVTAVETQWPRRDEDSWKRDISVKTEAAEREQKRFKVALSFPGERRQFVQEVAVALIMEFGKDKVFYDKNFEAELARPDLDTYLQEIYHDNSELIVVFLCAQYDKKEWCGLEWRAIRDLIKKRNASDVMPIRFDSTHIPGLFSIDGYVSVDDRRPKEIAARIIERYRFNQPDP